MKENIIKGVLTVALTAAGVYFRELIVPIIILVAVMIADYITGMMSAWAAKTLSSRIGLIGLAKKVGYLFGVGVAIVVDFIIQTAGDKLGVDLTGFYAFGLLVTIWLILNECISILENLSELGVPIPGFLKKVVERLKKSAEEKGDEGEKGE
ncbi:MAG: phage holin family protein [Oscillospiraceae bacterium]|nr:phage holin family protein [Oscillospiraceae bacterium]